MTITALTTFRSEEHPNMLWLEVETGDGVTGLGETFYVRNNYEGAAKAFAKGYKNFPEGAKAPDNLLKLGLSFRGMGQDESACHVFRKLTQNYPDAPAVIVNRVQQEQAEAACS